MRVPIRVVGICLTALLFSAVSLGCGSDEPSEPEDSTTNAEETPTVSSQDMAGMTSVDIYLVDSEAFASGSEPYVKAFQRDVDESDPITGAIDALFAGPNDGEEAAGITFVSSEASGAKLVSVEDGVARVQLEGGCDSGGSTLTIAAELIPTLQQFSEVQTVKILDPNGTTIDDSSAEDSTPECLEP